MKLDVNELVSQLKVNVFVSSRKLLSKYKNAVRAIDRLLSLSSDVSDLYSMISKYKNEASTQDMYQSEYQHYLNLLRVNFTYLLEDTKKMQKKEEKLLKSIIEEFYKAQKMFTEEILTKFENLKSISFQSVTANDDFCIKLFEVGPKLICKNKITEFSLDSCAPEVVSDEWFEKLSEFLCSFPNLEKLSLNGCKVGEHFIFISQHLKRCKSIDLQMNGIHPEIASCLINELDPDVCEEINLGANWIGAPGLALMRKQLMKFKNLKALHLNSNKLFKDSHDIDSISEIFKCFDKLEVLSIHENSCSETDFDTLCDVFSNYENLKELNVSRNRLTINSIKKFISCLIEGKFSNLEVLDFSFNQIGEGGLTLLIRHFIKHCPLKLRELSIRGMQINCESHFPIIKSLLQTLPTQVFKKLVLYPNSLRKSVKESYKETLDISDAKRLVF